MEHENGRFFDGYEEKIPRRIEGRRKTAAKTKQNTHDGLIWIASVCERIKGSSFVSCL